MGFGGKGRTPPFQDVTAAPFQDVAAAVAAAVVVAARSILLRSVPSRNTRDASTHGHFFASPPTCTSCRGPACCWQRRPRQLPVPAQLQHRLHATCSTASVQRLSKRHPQLHLRLTATLWAGAGARHGHRHIQLRVLEGWVRLKCGCCFQGCRACRGQLRSFRCMLRQQPRPAWHAAGLHACCRFCTQQCRTAPPANGQLAAPLSPPFHHPLAGKWYYTSAFVRYLDCADPGTGQPLGKVKADTTIEGSGGPLAAQDPHWYTPAYRVVLPLALTCFAPPCCAPAPLLLPPLACSVCAARPREP